MPVAAAQLRYPRVRALLPRTRLAYVHLQNLLTDAKRDRSARVFGYVAIWLPDELLLLYMEEGELVNATATADGQHWRALPIGEAVAKVPSAAEYGEICFDEADDEQLAAMYATQTMQEIAWPDEMPVGNAAALMANMMATLFDGLLEIASASGVNYVIFQSGVPLRGYYVDESAATDAPTRVRALLDQVLRQGGTARRFDVPPMLSNQAAPALIAAYRELVGNVVRRLADGEAHGAFAVAERARQQLSARHPSLERFSLTVPNQRDPVVETPALSAAIAAWLTETLWHLPMPDDLPPEQLIAEFARPRRYLFHAAGLFDALPWKITW